MSLPTPTSRRNVLLASVAVLGTGLLPRIAGAAPGARPNIVWLVCHDITASLLGTYGNPLARTPTIDKLAKDGVRFDNAFSVAPVCAPSRFALVTGMYPASCGPADHMRGVGRVPAGFKSLPVLMRANGYYCTNNVFTDYNADLDPDKIWDECSITAHWRNRPAGKPFFSVYNYLITHESRILHFEGTLTTDPAVVTVPDYLPDTPEIRKEIAENIDVVNRQDAAVKKILDQLEADGLADDTIVFFMADHGGLAPRSKRFCYDEGLRIPFIVRVPDSLAHLRAGLKPGVPARQVVSNIDVAPTTLALAGVVPPPNMHGKPFLGPDAEKRRIAFSMRNRMDERYDMVRTARDDRFRYIRNYAPHRIHGQHVGYAWQLAGYQSWERLHLAGKLTEVQDRFWNTKPVEELYDLEKDPQQLTNLAGNPAHRERLTKLSRALDEHMLSINDNGFVPESSSAEGYEASRQTGAYPIREVMALATLAARRHAANAPAFVKGLTHENEVMRYWAAQGLSMLGEVPAALRKTVRERLDGEKSVFVRCVLAEPLARSGEQDAAVAALSNALAGGTAVPVKLLALESLTHLPVEFSKAALPALEKLKGHKSPYISGAYNYLKLKIDGAYKPESRTYFDAPPVTGPTVKPLGDPRI
jgi:arylsulfatase A-like enzyme